jgi:hypothetical protein
MSSPTASLNTLIYKAIYTLISLRNQALLTLPGTHQTYAATHPPRARLLKNPLKVLLNIFLKAICESGR